MIAEVIFWLAVFSLFYTYLGYPALLTLLARNKNSNSEFYLDDLEYPSISLLLALHNEEQVLNEKLISLEGISYPPEKIEFILASDASTDGTDELLEKWCKNIDQRIFRKFDHRIGKVAIINKLVEEARGDILIITDANVFSQSDTVRKLIRHFKNQQIGLVDTTMKHLEIHKEGISFQEHAYITREVRIKDKESRIWGTMMGPSGGFYAVRKSLFTKVPENFLVDDFFINMMVLIKGFEAILEPEAIVFEDVSNVSKEEFRRKARIAAGSFQNLKQFSNLLLNPFKAIGFCFFSHKVLRWLGPFIILTTLISNLFLTSQYLYQVLLVSQVVLLSIPFIDLIIRKINIHIVILRFIGHFFIMNLAILVGFGWFIKGVKTNVWRPTKRNQS